MTMRDGCPGHPYFHGPLAGWPSVGIVTEQQKLVTAATGAAVLDYYSQPEKFRCWVGLVTPTIASDLAN